MHGPSERAPLDWADEGVRPYVALADFENCSATGVLNRYHTTATRIKTSSPSQTKDERNREAFSAKRATNTPTPDMITSIAAKRAQS